jgi:hypothetical protein
VLPSAGESCVEPCERRGDGVRLCVYSGRVLGRRSGEVFWETIYGLLWLLADLSLLMRVLESLLAWSRWRFSSLCSGVRLPRGGLEESDLAYTGMSLGSSYTEGVSRPGLRPGL